MEAKQPAGGGYLTGVANNPRSGWLEYFGCARPSLVHFRRTRVSRALVPQAP